MRAGREDLERYVLSPDPGSRVDLAILRGLAVEWASEHFPDYQVAIVYHDDNEGRIPHAHVVVNNTSLETGSGSRSPTPSSSTAPSSSSRRSAALLLKLLNFSCSRCSFPSDHSDHFLVNINSAIVNQPHSTFLGAGSTRFGSGSTPTFSTFPLVMLFRDVQKISNEQSSVIYPTEKEKNNN